MRHLTELHHLREDLDEQPDVIRVLSTPKIVSGVGSLMSKTDDGWKDNLRRIKEGSGKGDTIKI